MELSEERSIRAAADVLNSGCPARLPPAGDGTEYKDTFQDARGLCRRAFLAGAIAAGPPPLAFKTTLFRGVVIGVESYSFRDLSVRMPALLARGLHAE